MVILVLFVFSHCVCQALFPIGVIMLDFPVKFLLGYFPDSNSIFKIGRRTKSNLLALKANICFIFSAWAAHDAVYASYTQECVRGCYLVDGIDFCWIAGMWGVYFLVYRFMGCETGKTANINGLWIDRWYMRQDWIRPALAAAAITSLFYAENCKKINPSPLLPIDGQSI